MNCLFRPNRIELCVVKIQLLFRIDHKRLVPLNFLSFSNVLASCECSVLRLIFMRLSTLSLSLKCAAALSISEVIVLAYSCDLIFISCLFQELGLCTAMNHIVKNLDIKGIFYFFLYLSFSVGIFFVFCFTLLDFISANSRFETT